MKNKLCFIGVILCILMCISTSTVYGMQIFVKTYTDKIITLEVSPNELIDEVRVKLQEIENIPVYKQKLMFAGKVLEDGRSLPDYNIVRESNIHVILTLENTALIETTNSVVKVDGKEISEIELRKDTSKEFEIIANEGYKLTSVTVNDVDKIEELKDNVLLVKKEEATVTNIKVIAEPIEYRVDISVIKDEEIIESNTETALYGEEFRPSIVIDEKYIVDKYVYNGEDITEQVENNQVVLNVFKREGNTLEIHVKEKSDLIVDNDDVEDSNINENPDTGDTIITYLSMCIFSFAGIVLLYKVRKFRKE